MVRLMKEERWEWSWMGGGSNLPRQKKIPSKTPVLLGLIYLMGVLLNCKPSSEESRAILQ